MGDEDMSMKKKDLLFCLVFDLYMICEIIGASYYSSLIPEMTEDIIKGFILAMIIVISFLKKGLSLKRLGLMVCLGIGALVVYLETSMSDALVIIFLLIGSSDVDLRKVLKQSFWLLIALTFFVILSALSGMLPNDEFIRDVISGKKVRSFGFYGYATIPYIFMMLNMLYTYLKNTVDVKSFLTWMAMGVIVYYLFTNKLALILQILFYVLYSVLKKKHHYAKKLNGNIPLIMPWSCAAVSLALTYFFDLKDPVMYFINDILSWRLYYGKLGIERYSIRIFGQYVEMVGNMPVGKGTDMEYFYIDCGYIHTLLTYGILFYIVILTLYMIIGYYASISGDLALYCLIITILIGNCINNLWISMGINPVLLFSFTAIGTKRKSKQDHIKISGSCGV